MNIVVKNNKDEIMNTIKEIINNLFSADDDVVIVLSIKLTDKISIIIKSYMEMKSLLIVTGIEDSEKNIYGVDSTHVISNDELNYYNKFLKKAKDIGVKLLVKIERFYDLCSRQKTVSDSKEITIELKMYNKRLTEISEDEESDISEYLYTMDSLLNDEFTKFLLDDEKVLKYITFKYCLNDISKYVSVVCKKHSYNAELGAIIGEIYIQNHDCSDSDTLIMQICADSKSFDNIKTFKLSMSENFVFYKSIEDDFDIQENDHWRRIITAIVFILFKYANYIDDDPSYDIVES